MIAASAGTMELIERLVSIETTSRLSNLPLIEFVRDYLVGLGVEALLNYDDAAERRTCLPRSAQRIEVA